MPLVVVSASDTLAFGEVPIAGRPGSLQAAPRFPLGLVSTSDLLSWSNSFPSDVTPTLSIDITNISLAILLSAGTGVRLPLDNFEVSIDDEIIFIATRSGDTLVVGARGAENSVAAPHLAGATVQLLVTAVSHNQAAAEIIEIEQLLGPKGLHVFPTSIALTPGAAGNFTLAHGLGVIPRVALIQMTSGGSIWFQTSLYDATNLYLVASDAGVTGFAKVWA